MDAIQQDAIPAEPLLQPGQLVFVHCTSLPAALGTVVGVRGLERGWPAYLVAMGGAGTALVACGGLSGMADVPLRPLCHYSTPGGLA